MLTDLRKLTIIIFIDERYPVPDKGTEKAQQGCSTGLLFQSNQLRLRPTSPYFSSEKIP